jgi:hypothetical protein
LKMSCNQVINVRFTPSYFLDARSLFPKDCIAKSLIAV